MKQMKKYHNKRYTRAGFSTLLQTGACVLLILAFSCIAGGNSAFAADSISINMDTNNLNLDILPTSTSGSFATSANVNISISSTYSNGYTLSIVSSTGNTNLTNNGNSSNGSNGGNDAIFSSLTSAIDQATFSDSSNTEYNSKWGYKPSKIYDASTDQSTTNTNFRPLPSTTPEIIDKTSSASATANTYTLSFGARADSSLPTGTYNSDSFIITAIPNIIPLTITYDANGGYFGDNTSTTTNVVKYDATSETTGGTTTETVTKYSHTSNISDAGVQNGDYGNSVSTNDVVKIDGATSLHVKITYATESTNYDWAVIWAGNYPSYTAASNYSSGITCGGAGPKLGGTTKTTKECDITGDTVTFGFKSDGSVTNYGYYAVITADVTVSTTTTTYTKTAVDGTYVTPTNSNSQLQFLGWSESQDGNGAIYTNESEVNSSLPYINGDTVTLYAVWRSMGLCNNAATCMQTMVACPAADTVVMDGRDGKTYTVNTIGGECWMTQNLDFDIDSSVTYTSADTNLSSSWTPKNSTYTTDNTTWIWSDTAPESYDPGNKCWNGNINTSWNGTLDNMTQACTSGHYHIGNYYNWTAAVGMNDSSDYDLASFDLQEANQSICPAGWRLPAASGAKSYENLISGKYTATTSGNIQKSPVYFTYGGRWGDPSYGKYVGSLGEYWTSAAMLAGDEGSEWHAANMLYFDVDGLAVTPPVPAVRGVGFAVRCAKVTGR